MESNRGGDIDGEFNDFLGGQVAINSIGNIIVATGAGRNTYSSYGQVFELATGSWSKMGEAINGEHNSDVFGSDVAMNSAGDIVIIGADGYDAKGKNASGYAQVYEYTANNAQKWTKLGQDLEGDEATDRY